MQYWFFFLCFHIVYIFISLHTKKNKNNKKNRQHSYKINIRAKTTKKRTNLINNHGRQHITHYQIRLLHSGALLVSWCVTLQNAYRCHCMGRNAVCRNYYRGNMRQVSVRMKRSERERERKKQQHNSKHINQHTLNVWRGTVLTCVHNILYFQIGNGNRNAK